MTDKEPTRQPRAFAIPDKEDTRAKTTRKPTAPKTKKPPRKPRALPTAQVRIIEPHDDVFEREASDTVSSLSVPVAAKKRSLGGWIAVLLGILFSIAVGLWLESLIVDMFARAPWLGWATLGIVALLGLLFVIAIAREMLAIGRLKAITQLRQDAQAALDENNADAARKSAERLARHFASNPKTAAGRAQLDKQHGEIIGGLDLYRLAEVSLLEGLDAEARDLVMAAARRVSIVTAVSPRALVDIAYVLYENIRLIRTISEHYGGRTGALGTWRLARNVVGHLAVTGTIAVGDTLIQQLVGQGMASRLSARLGEGVVNGLMTVRVGLAAIDVCRPAPFHALPQPKLRQFMNVLAKFSQTEDAGPAPKAP